MFFKKTFSKYVTIWNSVCTTYDEAMAALVKHFVPKVNALACRHTFRQRLQRTDETVTRYVAALSALAAPCGFGQMESEMIRDQLIANAYLSAAKEKLLLEEDLTLGNALTITCHAVVTCQCGPSCNSTGCWCCKQTFLGEKRSKTIKSTVT